MNAVKRTSPNSSHHRKNNFSISLTVYLHEKMDFNKLVVLISWIM